MWDIVSTATGQTVATYATREQAEEAAVPMEHHRAWFDESSRFAFSHLPRPRMGQLSHAEQYARQHQQEQLEALMAHARDGRPLGGGCQCVACPYEETAPPGRQ